MIPAAFGFLLLAAGAMAMLAVPFVPMWREWRHPTDDRALAVDPEDANDIDYFARAMRSRTDTVAMPGPLSIGRSLRYAHPLHVAGGLSLGPGSSVAAALVDGDLDVGPGGEITEWARAEGTIRLGEGAIGLRRLSAGRAIELASDCVFERMSAPRIAFGRTEEPRGSTPRREPFELGWLPGASAPAPGVTRIDRAVVLPPSRQYDGSLIVAGSLSIGEDVVFRGSIKAHEGIIVGERARIEGALVSRSSIQLLAGARIAGPVVSEGDVVIGASVVIATPKNPSTVTAENILVEEGALVHGSVWARDAGAVWHA